MKRCKTGLIFGKDDRWVTLSLSSAEYIYCREIPTDQEKKFKFSDKMLRMLLGYLSITAEVVSGLHKISYRYMHGMNLKLVIMIPIN